MLLVNLCIYTYYHIILPSLIFMKFKIFYYEQKYEEAREYYNHSVSLYKITNNETILAELKDSAKTDYPEIFKE
jgi:hypothetical protein